MGNITNIQNIKWSDSSWLEAAVMKRPSLLVCEIPEERIRTEGRISDPKSKWDGEPDQAWAWAWAWAWAVVQKKWPHYIVSGVGVCYRLLQSWCLSSDFPLVQLPAYCLDSAQPLAVIFPRWSSILVLFLIPGPQKTQNLERPAICNRFSENQQDLWWDKQPAFSACSFSLLPSFSPAHTWLTTSNLQTTKVGKKPKQSQFWNWCH